MIDHRLYIGVKKTISREERQEICEKKTKAVVDICKLQTKTSKLCAK